MCSKITNTENVFEASEDVRISGIEGSAQSKKSWNGTTAGV